MRQQTRELLKSIETLLKEAEKRCSSKCPNNSFADLRTAFDEFSLWLEEEFKIHWKLDINENNRAVIKDMEKVLNEERRCREVGKSTKKR